MHTLNTSTYMLYTCNNDDSEMTNDCIYIYGGHNYDGPLDICDKYYKIYVYCKTNALIYACMHTLINSYI